MLVFCFEAVTAHGNLKKREVYFTPPLQGCRTSLGLGALSLAMLAHILTHQEAESCKVTHFLLGTPPPKSSQQSATWRPRGACEGNFMVKPEPVPFLQIFIQVSLHIGTTSRFSSLNRPSFPTPALCRSFQHLSGSSYSPR